MSFNFTGAQIAIDGAAIKQPYQPEFEWYNVTKAGRVASGKMMMELIAKKRKFLFKYPAISGTDRQRIMSLINGNKLFFTLSYIEDGVSKSAVVYVGAIKGVAYRMQGEWYWKDFQFDLIEQ